MTTASGSPIRLDGIAVSLSPSGNVSQVSCRPVGLARQSQANPGDPYNVLARFWDKVYTPPPDFVLAVNGLPLTVALYAATHDDGVNGVPRNPLQATNHLQQLANDDVVAIANEYLQRGFTTIRAERTFKPEFQIRWEPLNDQNYRIWSAHPNGLFTVYALDGLRMWPDDRPFPAQAPDLIEHSLSIRLTNMKRFDTYKTGEQARETVSHVTRTSMGAVKNQERDPDQVGAMGKLSPNDVSAVSLCNLWQPDHSGRLCDNGGQLGTTNLRQRCVDPSHPVSVSLKIFSVAPSISVVVWRAQRTWAFVFAGHE